MSTSSASRQAFSLIELAVVLAIAGIIAGVALKLTNASSTQDCYAATKTQLNEVRDAIERFATTNDRFPMPARRNVGAESVVYGREAVVDDLDRITNPDGGVAVFGAIPFQAIGLATEKAGDCWGNKLTYVVTQDLTDATKFVVPSTPGALSINSNATNVFLASAGYAIISHGADQLGAVKNNYSSTGNTLSDRKWCRADGTLGTEDCDVENSVLIAAQFNDGKDAGANFFDDVIVYRGKPWRATAPVKPVKYCQCPGGASGLRDVFTTGPKGGPRGGPTCGPSCGTTAGTCTTGNAHNDVAGACGTAHTWDCTSSSGSNTVHCTLPNAACTP